MMVDGVRCKRFAAHAKVGGTVREKFFRFREEKAHLAYRIVDVFSHGKRLMGRLATGKLADH